MNQKAAHIEDVYELSPLQQGMLFHTLRDTATSMYFHQVTYTLEGELDVPAFRRALRSLAEHYPALRTSYHWENIEKPVQVVHRQAEIPIEELDWRSISTDERESRLQEWLKQDQQRGFVVTQPPLMRVTIIRTGSETCHFVWSQHHILWDGWSGPLVLKDLIGLYEAERTKQEYRPARRRSFREYIAWLRQQDTTKAEQFWRKKLKGFSAPTPLGMDRGSGDRRVQPASAAEERLHLPTEFMSRLQDVCRTHQLTLNTVLQGAWAVLLGRYSGSDDVLFGTSVSGRPAGLSGIESMVGLFINTLPVRVRLPQDASILSWLRQLQIEQAELQAFEHSSLVQVQGWSDVPRGLPLFESMMVFVNYAADRVGHDHFGNLKVSQVRQAVQQTDCPLGLVVVPGKELWLRLVYDAGRFDQSAAARMLEHLRRVLESIVAAPSQRLADVSLLTAADRHQLLQEWNATSADYPADSCVHELVTECARRQPDAVALTFEGANLTYRELDYRANQLARHLRELGLRLEDRVALSIDRSIEMVVSILGVLKAGGTYVPIDPILPAERQKFMLEDSGVKILLSQERHRGRLPIGEIPAVYLDSDWPEIAKHGTEAPSKSCAPSNLAYIIYTSGSTGQPKGVLVQHGGLTNMVCAQVRTYGIDRSSRILQIISLNFDVAQAEILRALVGGATLVLATSEGLLPGWPLLNMLRNERITFAGILPAPLSAMPLGEELPSLRSLLVGGEQCPVELAAHWGRGRDIFNGYGPTEATVCTTIARNWDLSAPAPVGRPIANARVYVLDPRLQPVPVGIPGELYIGGAGVARGYMHQPALTAERFLPDPIAAQPGARMYRTGDLMRWWPDANLEFIGRIDGQIKLRGFRIELGEIETVLGQHPDVLNAAVIVREDEPNNKRLVAYVVPQREPAPTGSDLRAYLKGKLPEYMVPAAFVFMRELPRTTNDKVDRRLLPAPSPDQETPTDDLAEPRTPTEVLVAGIWCDLLKHNQVGVHDNFFELGGHSLLATQAVSRLRTAFNVDLSLRSFFEAATVAKITEQIEAARRELAVAVSLPPLVPVGRDHALPLSFAQQRLWFFEQLEPGSLFYSLPTAIRLTGTLDIAQLGRALSEIVRRHEVLRTTYVNRDGRPVQIISPPAAFPLTVTDLSHSPDKERETEARRIANEEANKPHDLERGPLVRVRLLRLSADEHVLLLSMHHIASDGWSMAIFFRELGTLYEAFAGAQQAAPAELPIQYADYAVWQRQWLQGEILNTQLAYWKEQLTGIEPMELPTDRVRPAEQRFSGAHETVHLPRELNERLTILSRREGVTPFMTFLAAFQVLLSRYARQDDISVGTPIAGRGQPETEGLIGFFVNTLVMRTDLSGNPTFRVLLKRVREVCLGAYDHQDIPFEKLVEELHPHRELGHNPIFQVLFVLQNAPRATRELKGLTLSRLDADFEPPAKFDLTLGMAENPDGVRTTLKYNAELFDAATIRRMLGHFQTLLHAIADHPEYPLAKLALMPEAERQLVVHDWNATDAAHPYDRCVHEMFEDQARLRPDAVALRFYERTVTYGDLNRRANRLARHLRRLGVTLESKVALVMDRSPEMIVGIIGILKAGGTYVPLNPGQPPDRIAFMLRDANARVLLTQDHYRPTLPEFDGTVIELDRIPQDFDDNGVSTMDQNPVSGVGPNNVVNVIFTSGSTGQPKGVLVLHRGLTNICCVQTREFGITSESRVMHALAYYFDASQAEIFRTLAFGATLCLAHADDLIPGPDMARLYRQLKISHATFPTSVLAAIPEDEAFPDLVQVCCGGEALTGAKATHWAKGRRFFNAYGPTETTVCATMAHGWDLTQTPPIGRPISNDKAYVLDAHLRPTPIGVPGELFIGGVGVARGYLQRPDLTAASFLPDPFGGRPGDRMYRTGDVVRWLADGQLDFMGRVDEQVKIRGIRIELGEIENTLLRHPQVADCAVVVAEDNRSDKWLVGYIAARQAPPLVSELMQYLRGRLPDNMVPRTLMFLPAIPRKQNGKVDRKQLPTPELGQADNSEHIAPRTPTEEIIASIWAELLKRDGVGVTDNFFNIGGHSLLATQLVSRLRTTFSVELPLRAVFETPTVSGLAEHIEKNRLQAQGLQSTPIAPVPRDQALPLSFAQQRLWFLDQLEPGNLHYAIPLSIRLTGVVNQRALERALAEILRRHEVLRTTFPMSDGQASQVIAPAVMLRLSITDLTDLPENEREARAREIATDEARQSFDLAYGPLLRARLLRLGEEDHALLLSLHHIVSDGWSMTIFFRELGTLYEAFAADRPSPLRDLHIQYADFAVWQRDWLRGSALETQLGYWKDKLSDIPTLNLPTDRRRPAVHRYRGGNYSVRLPSELSAKLQALSRQEGTTLFMTLLAAFQMLLSRYCGQDDVSVGTPIAGRNRAETENLIGFFVNTLVLRGDLTGDPTFKEFLTRVREVCLGAYAHQDLPFEKLVDELKIKRDLGRSPLFQVFFVLQNAPKTSRELAGLTLSRLGADVAVAAKFDLTLGVTETAEGLAAVFKYNADLFDEPTVQRMMAHWQTLLEAVVAAPDKRLSEFSICSNAERQLTVVEWNQTRTPFPDQLCVHQLFEAQVALSPDTTALTFAGREYTYRKLDRRANQLANYLRRFEIGPEKFAAIAMDRSDDFVIAVLGVLKAGGAYIPFDPAMPAERLALILADSQAAVILTQDRWRQPLSEHGTNALCLDTDWAAVEKEPDSRPETGVHSQNLVYVIYTSGSTGRPKGVLVAHRNFVNNVVAQAQILGIGPGSRVQHFVTLTADASQSEMFRALASGATLCEASADVLLPGAALLEHLRTQRITMATVPGPVFAALPDPDNLPDLRTITVGGDEFPVERLNAWSEGRRIFNGYGPTETTVCSTTATNWDITRPAPIGRPLPNVRVYVLDRKLQPAPVGVPGELHIGGDGVTRGYLNQPHLTAAAFLPDPFDERRGSRMYKSGDRVQWLADGQLRFLGRIDSQVKIRSFRVELGEIEAVLLLHPQVSECAAAVRQSSEGHKQLVAYFVPHVQPGPSLNELRSFLKAKLPDYMVPSFLVSLDALPKTASTKIDRAKLPDVELGSSETGNEFVPPRNAIEGTLADIWAGVLKVGRVGIHDNFFELGGDSILSIQVIARATQAGLRLTAKDLFQRQTVAELAAAAEVAGSVAADQGPVTGPVLLTPMQHAILDEPLHGAIRSILLETRQALDCDTLDRAFREVQTHHDALRLRFMKTDDGYMQTHADLESAPALHRVDLSSVPAASISSAIEAETSRITNGLDLFQGPLAQVAYFDCGVNRPGRLLVLTHSIIADAASLHIIVEDLVAAYQQLRRNQPLRLPPKTTTFKQWADGVAEHAKSDSLNDECPFWLKQTQSTVRELSPLHLERARMPDSRASVVVELEATETQALVHEVTQVYRVQMLDVLLTAWAQTVDVCLGQRAVSVDVETSSRLHADVDVTRTVGCFNVRYPLLLDLQSAAGPGEALVAIKERLRLAPDDGMGYGALRYIRLNDGLTQATTPSTRITFEGNIGEAPASAGAAQPPATLASSFQLSGGHSSYPLDITATVVRGKLRVEWSYSRTQYDDTTVERFAHEFLGSLRALIDHCRSPEAGGFSAADFPAARVSEADLSKLLSQLGQAPQGSLS